MHTNLHELFRIREDSCAFVDYFSILFRPMKRYPAFDPPEYVNWVADPALVAEFGETARRDPARRALVEGLGEDSLLALYAALVRNRLHDVALKRWVRQG